MNVIKKILKRENLWDPSWVLKGFTIRVKIDVVLKSDMDVWTPLKNINWVHHWICSKCSISQFVFSKRFPTISKSYYRIGKKSFIIADDFENPNICSRALKDANWIQTMDAKMKELEMNGTWEIIERPKRENYWLLVDLYCHPQVRWHSWSIQGKTRDKGCPQIYDMTIRIHFLSWQKWTLFIFYSIFLPSLGETILVWCQKVSFWTETWRSWIWRFNSGFGSIRGALWPLL